MLRRSAVYGEGTLNHNASALSASHLRPPMVIGGKDVIGEAVFDVINPATGQAFACAPECSRDELNQAMLAATEAFPGWSTTAYDARRDALLRAADMVERSLPVLTELLTREQGKPIASAKREIEDFSTGFRETAKIVLPNEVLQDDAAARIVVCYRPLGVVAAITPWNFPILLMGMKLGPALLAGNSVVLKPSPFTPLTTLLAGRLIAKVLPPGVLNVVSGGNELGAWMTGHPAVRKISFTGSVATGRRVATAAAPDLKHYTLELGGNDAAIVLDDADPAAITNGIFWGAFTNSGQICAGIKRLFVPEKLHNAVVEALVARAATTRATSCGAAARLILARAERVGRRQSRSIT